jgi:hypothetical protein
MIIALLLFQQILSLNAPAQTSFEQKPDVERATARLSERVVAHAARRGNPFINLTDGHALLTSYAGEQSAASLARKPSRGLSLAADDFDQDGKEDLVCGLASEDGDGLIALHRGNSDLIHPNAEAPFLAPARVFEMPVAAEFLASGDFDADSHRDVVAASSTDDALYLMRGDGQGGLAEAERIDLPGRVTALAAGEMNLADGLRDVVVGVTGSDGPQLLIFEGPRGALRQKPQVISLPSEATWMAIGQLDSSYEYDLAVAAGSELMIVHGRDRQLSLADAEMWAGGDAATRGRGDAETRGRGEANPATITREQFSFNIAAVAIGDFADDGNRRDEIAVLSEDGRLQYLQRSDETWQVTAGVGEIANGRRLIKTKVSSLATNDLLVMGRNDHIGIVSGGPGSRRPLHEMTTLDVEGEAAAALPMRLSGQALSDLVILKSDGELAVARVAPMATFTVTNTNDSGAGSLRQAILDANNNAGSDMIAFNIGSVGVQTIRPQSDLPTITDPVTIDATTQSGFSGTPLIELDGSSGGSGARSTVTTAGNGNGLENNAGNSVIKGLAIGNFNGHAISLQQRGGSMIMNNFLGTNAACTENRGNGGEGVNIIGSNDNLVMGNTIVFNADGGSVINSSGNVVKDNNLGTDRTMTRNKGNRGAGFGFANSFNNRFEGNRAGFNSFGVFSFGGGTGNIFGGEDPRLANIIGRNGVGMSFNNSSNGMIKTNFIGTDPQGNNLGNQGAGIELANGSSNNRIGGAFNFGNTIAFNTVGIFGTQFAGRNLYLNNSIFNNTSTGIDNNGGNNGISPPQLFSATASASETLITGIYFGPPGATGFVHFYQNPTSGVPRQGKSPIGGITVTADGGGIANFTARAPFTLSSLKLTAMATNATTNDTSEFSNEISVTSTGRPDLEVNKTGPQTARCREMITWTIEVRNIGTAAAVGFNVREILPTCVEDDVEVTTSPEGLISFASPGGGLSTRVTRLDPGASVTITVKATLTEDCAQTITNFVDAIADGDTNPANDIKSASTAVDCTKITGITPSGKHVIVSGVGFQRGDQIEINGILLNTKFRGVDELLAKKGNKRLLVCDQANPDRKNIIRLIRGSSPGSPIIDTEAFATCP